MLILMVICWSGHTYNDDKDVVVYADDTDDTDNGIDVTDNDLSTISSGGSLRSRHSPSRIQHFGRELHV